MWVILTRQGRAAVSSVARSLSVELGREFDERAETVRVGRHRTLVQAPYIAWARVQRDLANRTFGPRGGKRTSYSKEFTALAAITKELNFYDTHPAFKGRGMLGWQAAWFPAWATEDGGWTPYPTDGEFRVLCPDWTRANGNKITLWVPRERGPLPEHRLAQEATHVRLR